MIRKKSLSLEKKNRKFVHYLRQEPIVPSVITMKPFIGLSKHEEETNRLHSFSDAQTVERRGGRIVKQ